MESFKAELHYYLREHLWHHAVEMCNNELKTGKDPYVTFWKSFALSQENSLIDAIRDAESLEEYPEFYYSSTYALIIYHGMYPNPDETKINELNTKLAGFDKPSLEDILHSMRFASYNKDYEKYADLESKLTEFDTSENQDELVLKGWNSVITNDTKEWEKAQKIFENCVKNYGNENLDCILGGLKCLERLKNYDDLLDTYLEVIKINGKFLPLHIERLKIYLLKNDYENAVDYIERRLSKSKDFQLNKILALSKLMVDGNYKEIMRILNEMWDLMIETEPKNPELYYKTACLFRRMCDKNKEILEICEKMIDRALELSPDNSFYLTEKGYIRLFNGEMEEAKKLFGRSCELDACNEECSIGLIYCKILEDKYEEAKENIKFLNELHEQNPNKMKNFKLRLFEAMIFSNTKEKEEIIVNYVKDSLKIYIENSKKMHPWNKYDALIYTEYDSLFDMAYTLIKNYDFDKKYDSPTDALSQAKKILSLLKKNKYMLSSHLLNAKLLYILIDPTNAFAEVNTALSLDKNNLEAHMLQIKFYCDQKEYGKAKEVLNDAMISNYNTAKENSNFMILKCNCELAMNDIENAQKSLNAALAVFDKCLTEKSSKYFIIYFF